ncbi:hypothetical protein BDD12DRAFT_815571 [Trichophaea hybrida]|nr:hypothetical protein BDD12DRAFT_815571 [Trichophaea hybrida]
MSLDIDSASSTTKPEIRSLDVSKLQEHDVFEYFHFANPLIKRYGFQSYLIPPFELPESQNLGDDTPSDWLAEGLSVCQNAEDSMCGTQTKLILLDVLAKLSKYIDGSSFQIPKLQPVSKAIFSRVCQNRDDTVEIVGRPDIVVGHSESEILIAIVQTKPSTFFSILENAYPQLLSYLGMMHLSRKEAGRTKAAVYGIYTDGQHYRFLFVDEDSMVHRSKVFDIVHSLPEIFAFVYRIVETGQCSPNQLLCERLAAMGC